ncbi:hypothetical protein ABZS94_35280 [Streptomyces sp. NPDC005500]|uniref:hypothetical protein n=1 Tax=Streptomyces sp. NPDC005500 TaxID=3155007 RepID=UPI0033ABD99B
MATDFWVLLGTDYCGKSSTLHRIAEQHPHVRPVSYDSHLVAGAYGTHTGLHSALGSALQDREGTYSPDYIVALLNVAVVYLRDQALAAEDGRLPLVDSYYYKILAKSQLLGLNTADLLPWWQAFAQPTGVIFLESDVSTAWRRSGNGSQLNALEHYGDEPTRGAFESFQRDLRAQLLKEVSHLPVTHIPADQDVDATATAVIQSIKE